MVIILDKNHRLHVRAGETWKKLKYLDQEFANYCLEPKSSHCLLLVNKTLLEYNHTHLCVHYLWFFPRIQLFSSVHKDYMTYEDPNIYVLVLYRNDCAIAICLHQCASDHAGKFLMFTIGECVCVCGLIVWSGPLGPFLTESIDFINTLNFKQQLLRNCHLGGGV